MPEFLLPFSISAFFAEIVGTFTGFGTTTLLVPTASLFIPLQQAIVISGLFHLFGTFWRALFFAKGINWKIALIFGIPSLIFSALGASLLATISTIFLTKLLGVLLIVYALYSLLKQRLVLPQNPSFLAGGGILTGFLAGLVGTAGAIRGAFLTSWNLPKNVYLGTGAAMGLGADFTRVLVYKQSGLLKFDITLAVFLALVAFIGTFIGVKLVKSTQQEIFTKIVFVALILAGARFIL